MHKALFLIFFAAPFVAIPAFAAQSHDDHRTALAERAAKNVVITITRTDPDGARITETRQLSQTEFNALAGSDDLRIKSAAQIASESGAPPLPNPPLPGTLPDSTTSIDIHQRLNDWTRDTTYGRVPGGDWYLVKDVLEMHGPPPCNPNDDSCGNLPD